MYSNTKRSTDLNYKILSSLEEIDQCLPGIIDVALYHSLSFPEEADSFELYKLIKQWFGEISLTANPNDYLSSLNQLIVICEHSEQEAVSRELKKLKTFLSNNMAPFAKVLKEVCQARLFTRVRDNYLNN